jgi:hypothetical protein
MAELKTKATAVDPLEFLRGVADEQRRADCLTVLGMMERATGVKARMWGAGIVGFGKYAYRYASGQSGEWPVVGFAPRKNDLTIYLMPGFEGQEALLAKLGKHKTGKSCLYLKRLSDVDPAVLGELIRGAVEAMAGRRVE